MGDLIGYDEVAKRLGVATGTVYSWVSNGRIPCVRFGPRCVRFDVDEIDAWVQSHRRPAGTDVGHEVRDA